MATVYSPSAESSFVHSYLPKNVSSSHVFSTIQSAALVSTYRWPAVALLLVLYCMFSFLSYILFKNRPPKGLKLVPGPLSTIPYIGRVDINLKAPWFTFKDWADRFNGFYRTTFWGEMHIWVADTDIAQELLYKRAASYSGRPEIPALPGSHSQSLYVPLLTDGDRWRRHRKFVHTCLNTSQNNQYYGYISLETKRLLRNLLHDPHDHLDKIEHFCARITARLTYGSPSSAAAHTKNAAEFIPSIGISASSPITNLVPFLAKLPEWLVPVQTFGRQRREREERLWTGLMRQVRREVEAGTAEVSYARSYFERKAAAKNNGDSFDLEDHEAAYVIGMQCTMSILTIGAPMYCFMLAMVLHPEWQERCRDEIDAVVGNDRFVEISDSPKLPTLRACIKECVRWRPPVPLGVPHTVNKDDEYNGYFIPKGTAVHVLELSMARDPTRYPDPETYNPGRWLEPEYPTYKEPLTVHPRLAGYHGFGHGRRACPGVEMTEAELVVACGSFLWAFSMRPNIGRSGQPMWPDSTAFSSNVIGGPLPFKFDLKVRNEQRRAKIEELYSQEQERLN